MSYIRRVRKVQSNFRSILARALDQPTHCEPPPARGPFDPAGKRVIVIGIDPSLTGTALAVVASPGVIEWSHGWTDNKALQRRHSTKLSWYGMPKKGGTHANRVHRIDTIATWVLESVKEWASTPDYEVSVAIEGLAVSQRSSRASDLAELSGIIKRGLFCDGVPFRIYDPTTLKMAWTGQGKADKPAMVMQCFRRWRVDYTKLESAGDNFADATLLAHLLFTEIEVRSGRRDIKKDVDGQLRKILQRKTKAEPIPLVRRPLVEAGGVTSEGAILGDAW